MVFLDLAQSLHGSGDPLLVSLGDVTVVVLGKVTLAAQQVHGVSKGLHQAGSG